MISSRTPRSIKRATNKNVRASQLLESFSLKKTDLRVQLLDLFLNSTDSSLSQGQILEKLQARSKKLDRVTVYRNLLHFKQAGLIHEVESNLYVCCTHKCRNHAHVLFVCQSCHQHQEVHNHKQIQKLFQELSQFQFFKDQSPLSIRGVCQKCETLNPKNRTETIPLREL
jgi:Fur family zinc uptake transcriptional regulator